MKRALNLLVVMTCLLLAACAVNPVTGSRNFTLMSEADEMRKGQQAAIEIAKVYEVYDDLPALQNYVNEIGRNWPKTAIDPSLTIISPLSTARR
jgi:hypothetical protein